MIKWTEPSGKYLVDIFNYSKPVNVEDLEADYFALNLLVPKHELERLWSITHDLEDIARYFGVSRPVIEMQFRNL